MPSNFPKEWIHSSYGFPSNFFNQFTNNENNTTNSNQENNIEANKPTTSLHEQQDQYNDDKNNLTPTQQEKQRLVINDNDDINNLLNQYSSFDDQAKITSTKYQASRDPPYLSKPTNSNTSNNSNGSNIITTGEENENLHIKSAPRTNSIDSNHAVMNVPLSMDSDNNNNKTHGNYLPMGHNRDEEIKIMPTKTMPGTFSSPSDPSPFNSILHQLQQQPTTIEEASSYQHDQQMNMAIKSAIDSTIAGSALSSSLSSVIHSLTQSSHESNQSNVLNDRMTTTSTQNIKKNDAIENINDDEQQTDELHPLVSDNNNNNNNNNDRGQLQQNPTTITDPFQFEKNDNGLNNDNLSEQKQRRKSLPSNQCAAALPVLGSYVPFAQGTAVTFNSRERHNAESQRKLSTDRRYSLRPETLNQQQQHEPDEHATNQPNRRNSINVASLARFFHLRKKSN
ncbi:hypothetical protein BJ944DRAFT_287525 [Cunninghamella echinulata]|nr:hypothetical protein BJ944DRAFT_287525 [Cunninghamella echinulata]